MEEETIALNKVTPNQEIEIALPDLNDSQTTLAVIGLGYVGLPLVLAFAKHMKVIGYDSNPKKVESLRLGFDPSYGSSDDEVRQTTALFTNDQSKLQEASIIIVCVPTPIHPDKTPDLTCLKEATMQAATCMRPGSVVIYESTVYPGTTEEVCIPILNTIRQLTLNQDYFVGYSPERINPNDNVHTLQTITKLVAGSHRLVTEWLKKLYQLVVHQVHAVSSIQVAEAAKVVENAQRDINIAFMNELAMVFHAMKIDTKEVIEAMNTKWNALGFQPGLVGGHCIGIDPYYFLYKAELLGFHSQIMSAGRRINDTMPNFVSSSIVKELIQLGLTISDLKVGVLGLTYKENSHDLRNSKVIPIIRDLMSYGIQVYPVDDLITSLDLEKEYGLSIYRLDELPALDAIVLAVGHQQYLTMTWQTLRSMCKPNLSVLFDIKGVKSKNEALQEGFHYWRL